MNMASASGMFDAAAHWHLWLLAAALVLCWGLVVAATGILFGGTPRKRTAHAGHRRRRPGAPGQSTHHHSPQTGPGNG